MPLWLIQILAKLGFDLISLAINYLEEKGVISHFTAEAARLIHETKTYNEFPETEGQRQAEALDPGTTNTNMTVGHPPVDDDYPSEVKSG